MNFSLPSVIDPQLRMSGDETFPAEDDTPQEGLPSIKDQRIVVGLQSKVIIYHHTDMDGCGSAALAKHYFESLPVAPTIVCVPTDYNNPQPFVPDDIDEYIAVMVDLTRKDLLPMLAERAAYLIWIDHHLQPYTEMEKSGVVPAGIRNDEHSGIFLTWQYFYPDREVPNVVQAVNEFDMGVWTNDDPQHPRDSTKVHFGLVANQCLNVDHRIWRIVTDNDPDELTELYVRLAEVGKLAIAFELETSKETCKGTVWVGKLTGRPTLIGNFNPCYRRSVDSVFDPDKHDLILLYYITDGGQVSFSLYVSPTKTDDFNAAEFASKHGGGGHPAAAGFSLPLKQGLDFIAQCRVE